VYEIGHITGYNISNEGENAISGEELFSRYLSGDDSAFERLVALYEDGLANYIFGIVRDRHETKHLTIESFAQLAVGGRKFAGKSSLKTYLYTIGKNLAYRYVKMRGNEQHVSFEEIESVMGDRSNTPEDIVLNEEKRKRLKEVMRELKDEHFDVLVLLYFEDMSYLQAGQVMKKSEKQIKHLVCRAKASLRKKLENHGFT